GARVTALDRSAGRLKRLEENLARVRLRDKVEVIAADAAVWSPPEAPALILLDAPCSATGTLRRHPDVAYLKTPADIGRLLETQARILDHAFSILAPGGTLLYCVCSLQKDEGERQITRFLEKMPSAYKKPVSPREIGGLEESVTEDGDLRVLPFHQAALGGMDGFFISRIVKTD
ncbi:MAG: RsmB/NOP family class I SAM-dependent RNA methyltransferase, partial [Alphaproteobacteria bacterium]|nr:RsmB/NOP family class I SAM-dependent RNA methyltransferase [Alphaproteobacteria bacterium]